MRGRGLEQVVCLLQGLLVGVIECALRLGVVGREAGSLLDHGEAGLDLAAGHQRLAAGEVLARLLLFHPLQLDRDVRVAGLDLERGLILDSCLVPHPSFRELVTTLHRIAKRTAACSKGDREPER